MESIPTVAVDGAQLVYRRIGGGRPLLVLNGFGATSADWDPSFIDRLASSNELILLNNRGIGGSTDDGQPFDIAKLADDASQVIEALGFEHVSLLGWSMGGFIAADARGSAPSAHRQARAALDGPGRNRGGSRLT